ncbi:MAG TPA: RcpC/CpaB family pilus assembly protein [Candidatus Limnocylindrales bacterium]|jgi:Flp pilus assembly protein CpaB|nr:RcpC/CpaB family pilus assembly protein [Candidatus Limnocylindrales bacterium]
MRARRGVYATIFLVAALSASALVYLAQPRNGIVRATVDIPVLAPITADMVQVVLVSPADAPANAARSIEAVVGRYAAVPVLAGQDVDVRILETNPGQRSFGFGAPLGAGQVAFALQVEPGQAVGGALAPGARVDVVAVPNALKTQVSGADSPSAVVLGQGLVILTVRTPEGEPLTEAPESDRGSVVIPPKLGSVVVAIPAARLSEFAEAALSSTFYLALSPSATP